MPTWLWAVIINGVILGIIVGLIRYIWKSMEGRVKSLEGLDKAYDTRMIEHPIMTIAAHAAVCTKNTSDMKQFVESQTSQLGQKMDEGEKRTGLLIENAVLKASKNGKAKGRKAK